MRATDDGKIRTRQGASENEQDVSARDLQSSYAENGVGLTELVAARPVAEQAPNDDLELEEMRAQAHGTGGRHSSQSQNDVFLTEVAVPKPANDDDDLHNDYTPKADKEGQPSDLNDRQTKRTTNQPWTSSVLWREVVTVSWLVFFSFLGTLARLGVEAIVIYPYSPTSSPVLWANLGGSLFFGFLLEDRRLFRYSVDPAKLTEDEAETKLVQKTKKILPLYVGLATGFCGSFTSFSTFITDAFLALTNDLAPANPTSPYHAISSDTILPRNGGFSFMATCAILILHPAVSIGALKAGSHLAVGLESVTPSLPKRLITKVLDPAAIVLGFGCWLGAVILSIWPPADFWRRRATMALVFAPTGCLLRYYLSKTLNGRVASFPLGTFAANVFGTCIAGMCYDLQHTRAIIGNVSSGRANSCAVLEGVIQGYCGCLTTVSTWVGELNGLRPKHAWLYGVASVAVALGFQVVIMGSVAWSIGFDYSCSVRP